MPQVFQNPFRAQHVTATEKKAQWPSPFFRQKLKCCLPLDKGCHPLGTSRDLGVKCCFSHSLTSREHRKTQADVFKFKHATAVAVRCEQHAAQTPLSRCLTISVRGKKKAPKILEMVWFEAQPWGCAHLRCWWLFVVAGQMSPSWRGYQMEKIFQSRKHRAQNCEKFKFYKIQMSGKTEQGQTSTSARKTQFDYPPLPSAKPQTSTIIIILIRRNLN